MKELLNLPERFAVKKKLTKDKFLSAANLTENEKKSIERFVSKIDIAYNVVFPDKTEIVVLDIDLKLRESSATDKFIGDIVSRVVPHDCLILAEGDGFGVVTLVLTRESSNDEKRRIKLKQISSPVFDTKCITSDIRGLFAGIEDELLLSNNSAEAMFGCEGCIERCKESHSDYFVVNQRKEKQKSDNIIRQIEYGLEHTDEVLRYENDRVPLNEYFHCEEDKKLAQEDYVRSERALYDSAYALYSEVEDEFDKTEWLLIYANCCSEVLEEYYYAPASDGFYQKLGARFAEEYPYTIDDECVDTVRERLELAYTEYSDFEADETEEDY